MHLVLRGEPEQLAALVGHELLVGRDHRLAGGNGLPKPAARGIEAADDFDDDVHIGAEDIVDEGEDWRVTSAPTDMTAVRDALDEAGITYSAADVTMLAKTTVALGTAEAARKVLRLIDALDEHDDVQDVFANFDIPDEILEAVDA